jgi:predicted peroxiredoxin
MMNKLEKEEKRLEKLLKEAIESGEFDVYVVEGKVKIIAINEDELKMKVVRKPKTRKK